MAPMAFPNFSVTPVTGIGRHFDSFVDFGKSTEEWFALDNDSYPYREAFSQELLKKQMSLEKLIFFARYILKHRDVPLLKTYMRRYTKMFRNSDPIANSASYSVKSLYQGYEIIRNHAHSSNPNPYFLFINLMEPHHYYNPPKEHRKFTSAQAKQAQPINFLYSEKFYHKYGMQLDEWIALYDDEVLFMDHLLGKFIAQLRQSNLMDDLRDHHHRRPRRALRGKRPL